MQKTEKPHSHVNSIAFIDFKPAELKINKEWIIVYYAKNPVNNKMDRYRLRVPTIKDKTERLKHAKRIVFEINKKLAASWSPFMEESGKNFKTFQAATDEFLKHIEKQVKDNVMRPDTLRTYNSNLNLLNEFIRVKALKITFAVEVNKNFCVQYLDWIYIDRNSSPRTRNNHLSFIKLFCSYLFGRGVLKENPALNIPLMKKQLKKREVIPANVKKDIYNLLMNYDNGFYTLCMTTYYCFVRNSELGKLKVNMVNLNENWIFLSKEISKNKKDEFVTIPTPFLSILKNHIANAKEDDYLFSSDNFKPGSIKMPVRKIASFWDKIRDTLNLPSKYQFYSLKDTGITDLLNSGVAAIKVRDQARHYDIKMTEIYTPRNKSCDETIKNSGVEF